MAEKYTEWFVKALDTHTNEAIAKALAQTELSDETQDVRDGDGRSFKVFSVDHPLIAILQESAKSDRRFKFKVYKRHRNYGPVEEWQFGKGRRRKSAKTSAQ